MRALAIATAALVLAGAPIGALHAQAAKPPAGSKFLQPGEMDPTLILPPPPAVDSPRTKAEIAELHRLAAERSPERLAQAKRDSDLEDARAIAAALGPAFELSRFPASARLFADLRHEDSVAAKQAKAYFKRPRPFEVDGPAINVCEDGHDHNNSYPSGHATMGYAAAAVMADLMPGNAQVILAHTADYTESRLYCGVHYRSDLLAGEVLANVLVQKLMTKPAFQAELEAARAELTAAHIAP
jgi:acid phosphatase (class A)